MCSVGGLGPLSIESVDVLLKHSSAVTTSTIFGDFSMPADPAIVQITHVREGNVSVAPSEAR